MPRVHFDEAWYAYGKFHPIYKHRYAMGVPRDMKNRPTVFSVQSTHKMLPAFSMASYIHVSNSERAQMEWAPLKEAFMMHGTTSPFYPLIASLDIASAMMDEPTGPALLRETIGYAVEFRKAVGSRRATVSRRTDEWFFTLFQPDKVTRQGQAGGVPRSVPTRRPRAAIRGCWTMRVGDSWHGLPDDVVADDFCHARPDQGHDPVPRHRCATERSPSAASRAPILTKFLDARRQEIARTGDYTVLVLFSVGTTQGKWGTLLETLLRSSASTTARPRSRKRCRNSSTRTPRATAA